MVHERVRSLSSFLDGCSEFLEVRLFEIVKLLLICQRLPLILKMDSVNSVLALSQGLWLVIVVLLHLDLFDVSDNLVSSLDKKLCISELLIEEPDRSLEIVLLKLNSGGCGEMEAPLHDGEEWEEVV